MKYIANKTNIPFQPFSPRQILLQLREEFRFEARVLAMWSAILCAVLSGCTLAMISAPPGRFSAPDERHDHLSDPVTGLIIPKPYLRHLDSALKHT
jgi:hypothetical protein